jgi:hypothetical protein
VAAALRLLCADVADRNVAVERGDSTPAALLTASVSVSPPQPIARELAEADGSTLLHECMPSEGWGSSLLGPRLAALLAGAGQVCCSAGSWLLLLSSPLLPRPAA